MSSPNTQIAVYFAREQPRLRAFIRSLVFSPSDVDDILQDVAVIAINNLHRYEPSRPLHAWILGIARKRVLKYFDSRQRQQHCFGSELVESLSTAMLDEQGDNPSLDQLQDCLAKLEPQQREVLLRRHSAGVTARQVAQEIGYTDTRMSRLLNSLYAALMKCIESSGRPVTAGGPR